MYLLGTSDEPMKVQTESRYMSNDSSACKDKNSRKLLHGLNGEFDDLEEFSTGDGSSSYYANSRLLTTPSEQIQLPTLDVDDLCRCRQLQLCNYLYITTFTLLARRDLLKSSCLFSTWKLDFCGMLEWL
uniref:Uncharacterized protein n=1 Tax=Cacopsylla melanoneura TaxID=428564 RepID=A0A8D8TMT5_9HEMI